MTPISNEAAMEILKQGGCLRNCVVEEIGLVFRGDGISFPVHIENCEIRSLYGPAQDFNQPVSLTHCFITKAEFISANFCQGLVIDNCLVESYLNFEASGHNAPGYPIKIHNSTFRSYVNFFDCWFEELVFVENNHFEKGTNLLGNIGQQGKVHFNLEPVIRNNSGDVACDGWGDHPTTWISYDNT